MVSEFTTEETENNRVSGEFQILVVEYEKLFYLENISTIFLLVLFCVRYSESSFAQDKTKIDFESCTFKEFPLNGKIKFVDSFPDIKIQVVESFPDLKVKIVNSFPDDCGEWQIVDSFPDVKIKIVESFPDIKIKFVESFPGKP